MTDEQAPPEDDLLSAHEVVPKAVKAEVKIYTCDICRKIYAKGPDHIRRTNLANHMRHQHKDAAPAKAKAVANLPKSAVAAKATPEPKPKARKPAGENLALLVSGGAQLAASSGHIPLAQALAFEAPAAGQAIDTAIAGSFIDRKIVQPITGGAEKWEAVGACLTLPLMVHLISVYPQMQGPLLPHLRRAVEDVLVLSVPTIRKRVEKDRKLAEALEELGHLDKTIADDPDPVGSILEGFFVTPGGSDAS
jgi:hypothetical protein